MQLVDSFVSAWKNAFNFKGRARRSAYWYFVLANLIVSILLNILGSLVGVLALVAYLYSIAVFFPSLSLSVRRLHDISKSGWFYLFILIPLVGWIFVLVWMCKDSTPGPNQYGPNPKGFAPYGEGGWQQPSYQGQNYQQPNGFSQNQEDRYKGPEL